MTFQPLPPISRRETALRRLEPVERLHLLTPGEREEAALERERKRARKRDKEAKKAGAQAEHGHADYLG
jgi:hypothetical protein